MGKRKRTHKNNDTPIVLNVPNEMSADDLQHIIAGALVEVDEKRRQMLEKQQKDEHRAWQENIGVKNYSHEKNPKKWLLEFFNTLYILGKISFISKEKIKGDRITFSILQLFLSLAFSLVDKLLLFLSGYLFYLFLKLCRNGPSSAIEIVMSVTGSLLAFMVSRLFHISSLEIENMKDRNYLLGLFACITAIISIIISVIGIIV